MGNKICIATTIKTSLDDTFDFVNYHLNIGIDHIYLFFDDPEDVAFKILSKYKKVTCFKCGLKHWNTLRRNDELVERVLPGRGYDSSFCLEERQQLNANFALKLARKNKYDWIVHMDSDELIYSNGPLKKIFLKFEKSSDALRLLTLEAVPGKLAYKNILREISLFRSFGAITRFYYTHKKMLQKIIPRLKKNEGESKIRLAYFNGNTAGKSIVSINGKIKNLGIHEPVAMENHKLIYVFPRKMFLLHFECKSFEDWKNKMIKFYDNPSDAIGSTEGAYPFLKKFVIAYKNNDIEEMRNIYKKKYFIPRWRRMILMSLGLLKRVRLDKKMFLKANNL